MMVPALAQTGVAAAARVGRQGRGDEPPGAVLWPGCGLWLVLQFRHSQLGHGDAFALYGDHRAKETAGIEDGATAVGPSSNTNGRPNGPLAITRCQASHAFMAMIKTQLPKPANRMSKATPINQGP